MHNVDESVMSPAMRAALAALEALTLAELGALEMYHVRRVKRRLAVREAAAAGAAFAAEVERVNRKAETLQMVRIHAADDGEGGYDLKPAGEVVLPDTLPLVDPYALVPDEDDDDDEPADQDATPLEVVDPPTAADVAEALAYFEREQARD